MMSGFWHWWVIVLTLGNIAACYWLIKWTAKTRPGEVAAGDVTGHSWDGLEEYNNPLPNWWLWLFYLTLVFGIVYLILYPGLGNFKGVLGWTEVKEWQQEVEAAEAKYGPIFQKYAGQDIAAIAKDPEALEIGGRLFANYCAQCHGSDAQGGGGFPNLTDNDWLYGGSPEAIEQTILNGRQGNMPAWGPQLGEDGVKQVTAYVLSLSGRKVDPALASAGKEKYQTFCSGCHGADGKGNQALGAPNLTDKVWLYGGSRGSVEKTIREGRAGRMPAFKDFLGKDKVHLLAGYVYSLSQK